MFKRIAIGLLTTMIAASAFADAPVNITVQNEVLGTGVPEDTTTTSQPGYSLPDGVYHVPQYLPGVPTAATIYPRVIEVDCTANADGSLNCEGYHWLPEMGRAEYLLVKPRIVVPAKPQVVVVTKTDTVIKEVPVKKGKE